MTAAATSEDLAHHDCDRQERWAEYDGCGIFLTFVCDTCCEEKLSKYRPEILKHYTQADVDEPIDNPDEDW